MRMVRYQLANFGEVPHQHRPSQRHRSLERTIRTPDREHCLNISKVSHQDLMESAILLPGEEKQVFNDSDQANPRENAVHRYYPAEYVRYSVFQKQMSVFDPWRPSSVLTVLTIAYLEVHVSIDDILSHIKTSDLTITHQHTQNLCKGARRIPRTWWRQRSASS